MKKYAVVEVSVARNEVRDIEVKGAVLRGALAPIDFPERLRVGIEDEPAPCHIFIDFLYPMGQNEPTDARPADGGRIFLGRTSGRIFRVELQVPEGMKSGKIQLNFLAVQSSLHTLQEEANSLPLTQRPPRRIAHYGMLSDLLPAMEPAISASLDKLRQVS